MRAWMAWGAFAVASLLWAPCLDGQGMPVSPMAVTQGPGSTDVRTTAPLPGGLEGLEGRYIVVTLADHRLHLMEGNRVLWSAIVGTGRGTRLEGAGQRWDFSTPRGMFRIQAQEKDPIWFVPDWAFVQRGEPIPPQGDPRRREPGMLGTTALYMEEGIAIHGTNHPELLGQAVSAGCIRMTNEDARRLYHMVEVGTPVLIY